MTSKLLQWLPEVPTAALKPYAIWPPTTSPHTSTSPLHPPCSAPTHTPCLTSCETHSPSFMVAPSLPVMLVSWIYMHSSILRALQVIFSNSILTGKFTLNVLPKSKPPILYVLRFIHLSSTALTILSGLLTTSITHLFVCMLTIYLCLLVNKLNEAEHLLFITTLHCLKQYDSCSSTQIYVKLLNRHIKER